MKKLKPSKIGTLVDKSNAYIEDETEFIRSKLDMDPNSQEYKKKIEERKKAYLASKNKPNPNVRKVGGDIVRTPEEELKEAGIFPEELKEAGIFLEESKKSEKVIKPKQIEINIDDDGEINFNDGLFGEKVFEFSDAMNEMKKNLKSESIPEKIKDTFSSLTSFLLEKNKRYGDSALNPLDIFDNVIENEPDMAVKAMLIRLADKTKRIKNSKVLRKNDVVDQIGYWILICIKKGWTNFEDLID